MKHRDGTADHRGDDRREHPQMKQHGKGKHDQHPKMNRGPRDDDRRENRDRRPGRGAVEGGPNFQYPSDPA